MKTKLMTNEGAIKSVSRTVAWHSNAVSVASKILCQNVARSLPQYLFAALKSYCRNDLEATNTALECHATVRWNDELYELNSISS